MPINLVQKNTQWTEAERIKAVIDEMYIIDIGYIQAISSDKKTVDIVHAVKPQVRDFTTGDFVIQQETVTHGLEVLYYGGANYRLEHELQFGDVGLLLGTCAYIEKARDLTAAQSNSQFYNYQQENLKFFPIGSNQTPVTLLTYNSDEIKMVSSIKNTTIDLKTNLQITTDADLQGTFDNQVIKTTSNSIEMNNSSGNNRMAIDNNLIDIKNSVSGMKTELQKIYTLINDLITALNTLSGTNCVNGSPLAGATAFQTYLSSTLVPLLNTDNSNVANIFKS